MQIVSYGGTYGLSAPQVTVFKGIIALFGRFYQSGTEARGSGSGKNCRNDFLVVFGKMAQYPLFYKQNGFKNKHLI